MTNREKFKDELVEFRSVAFDITDNKVKECYDIDNCIHCQFCDYNTSCNEAYKKWLDEEYIEIKKQPTDKDIEIMKACKEIFGFSYFAKDTTGDIYGYEKKPYKAFQNEIWSGLWSGRGDYKKLIVDLSHLSWDDDEPYYFKGE